MRYLVCLIAALALAGVARAETLEGVGKQVDDIQNGRDTGNQIKTLRVSGNGTVGGTLTVTGALTPGSMAASALSGNIAIARMTNALPSAGSYLGGNIPLAALTNAITGATGVLVTNDVLVAGGGTNRWILAPIGGKYIVVSITGL